MLLLQALGPPRGFCALGSPSSGELPPSDPGWSRSISGGEWARGTGTALYTRLVRKYPQTSLSDRCAAALPRPGLSPLGPKPSRGSREPGGARLGTLTQAYPTGWSTASPQPCPTSLGPQSTSDLYVYIYILYIL